MSKDIHSSNCTAHSAAMRSPASPSLAIQVLTTTKSSYPQIYHKDQVKTIRVLSSELYALVKFVSYLVVSLQAFSNECSSSIRRLIPITILFLLPSSMMDGVLVQLQTMADSVNHALSCYPKYIAPSDVAYVYLRT